MGVGKPTFVLTFILKVTEDLQSVCHIIIVFTNEFR